MAEILYGMRVVVEPLRMRYALPADVPPPTGMTRVEFDSWSRAVCGYREPVLMDGEVLSNAWDNTIRMNERTWDQVKREFVALSGPLKGGVR